MLNAQEKSMERFGYEQKLAAAKEFLGTSYQESAEYQRAPHHPVISKYCDNLQLFARRTLREFK